MSLGVIEIKGTLFAYAYAETKSIARGGEMCALDIITIIALLLGKQESTLCMSVCVSVWTPQDCHKSSLSL